MQLNEISFPHFRSIWIKYHKLNQKCVHFQLANCGFMWQRRRLNSQSNRLLLNVKHVMMELKSNIASDKHNYCSNEAHCTNAIEPTNRTFNPLQIASEWIIELINWLQSSIARVFSVRYPCNVRLIAYSVTKACEVNAIYQKWIRGLGICSHKCKHRHVWL